MKMKIQIKIHLYIILLFCVIQSAIATDIQVGFSPGKSINIILHAINTAKSKIDIAIFSFTSKEISTALLDAKNRGVIVRVIADKKANSGKYTAVTFLVNKGISVKLNDKYKYMHNKFMIIDEKSVQTGSFNYSKAAVKNNAENVLYIIDNKRIAKQYTYEFNRLWKESISIHSNY